MSKNIINEQESLIEFPCNFIIKVTGVMKDNFTHSIIEEINKVDKTFNASKIEIKGRLDIERPLATDEAIKVSKGTTNLSGDLSV